MKKIKIIIITLVIVLILGSVTFATLYFATDVFKSDKDMFYKYMGQIKLNQLIDKDFYKEYSIKLRNSKYEEKTNISIKTEDGGEFDENIDMNMTIETKKDVPNKLFSSEIHIKNVEDEKDEKLDLKLLRDNDLYGLLFKDIVGEYIVLENNNLKKFFDKLGEINLDEIPNKIETKENNVISEEQTKEIINRYSNLLKEVILKQIPKESYSKSKEEDITVGQSQIGVNCYEIKLNISQLNNILNEFLEEIKNDREIYDILSSFNKELTMEQYKKLIEDLSTEIFNQSNIDQNTNVFNIKLYEKNKKVIKLSILLGKLEEESYINISIENLDKLPIIKINMYESGLEKLSYVINNTENTNERKVWEINVEDKESNLSINANLSREGDINSDKVNNTIKITIANQAVINFDNTIIFNNNVEIEKFEDVKYKKINDLSQEKLNNLFTNLGNLLHEKVEKQGTYIGAVSGLFYTVLDGAFYDKIISTLPFITGIIISVNLKSNIIPKAMEAMEQTEVASFNGLFTAYEGKNISESDLRILFHTVQDINSAIPDHAVSFVGIKNESEIIPDHRYKVSFSYDEDYISKIIIEDLTDEDSD